MLCPLIIALQLEKEVRIKDGKTMIDELRSWWMRIEM